MIWACPVCQSPLVKQECQWLCDNNHSFDIAKQGYSNLLLANQKRSADPGDTREMMDSRRAFLSAGHYQPLAAKLVELLSGLLPAQGALLDSGCGEGYYLSALQQARPDLLLYGIDISRDAVKLAARQNRSVSFSVASSFHLPVLPDSLDGVLRIFAPGDNAEVSRVLKSEGKLVVVAPGPRHLFALKQIIYPEAREHLLPDAPESFELIEQHSVSYELALQGNETVKQLLAMTPFYWKASAQAKAQLGAAESLTTEVDFYIAVYQFTQLVA